METHRHRWSGHRLLLVTLWLTLMMLAIKVWIGWATRSLSLLAEALFTLVVSFSLLLGFLSLSTSSATKAWGHTRLESGLTLLLIGFLGSAYCLLIGIAVGQIGFFQATAIPGNSIQPAIVQLLGGMAVLSVGLSFCGRYQARVLNNSLLRFSFNQLLQDAGLLILAIASLLGTIKLSWLDLAITAIVLLLLFFNVWRIVSWQLPSMLQQVAIAPEAVVKLVRQVEGILHCYGIQSRGMVGRSIYVELRLILHPECLTVAPAIIQRVERLIVQHYGPAKVVVQVDQMKSEGMKR